MYNYLYYWNVVNRGCKIIQIIYIYFFLWIFKLRENAGISQSNAHAYQLMSVNCSDFITALLFVSATPTFLEVFIVDFTYVVISKLLKVQEREREYRSCSVSFINIKAQGGRFVHTGATKRSFYPFKRSHLTRKPEASRFIVSTWFYVFTRHSPWFCWNYPGRRGSTNRSRYAANCILGNGGGSRAWISRELSCFCSIKPYTTAHLRPRDHTIPHATQKTCFYI